MSFLFGKKKTPAEMLREHQRTINRAIREMEREQMKLEQSEKKLVMDIKREAKKGNNVCHIIFCSKTFMEYCMFTQCLIKMCMCYRIL